MASAALTPELALDYLAELQTDVRAAVLLAPDGSVAAVHPDEESLGEVLRAAVADLLATAEKASSAAEQAGSADSAGEGNRVAELEVTAPAGSVFVVRRGGWTAAVVAAREVLSSLIRYDLAMALDELSPRGGDGGQAASPGQTTDRARPAEEASVGSGARVGPTGGGGAT